VLGEIFNVSHSCDIAPGSFVARGMDSGSATGLTSISWLRQMFGLFYWRWILYIHSYKCEISN